MALCHHEVVGGSEGSGATSDGDHVHLRLPADGPAASLARAAATTLGRQAGFGRGVLGPLTLAVDEALVLLLPSTAVGVDLDALVTPGRLQLTLRARAPHATPDREASERFDDVVAGLVTSASLDRTGGVVRLDITAPRRQPPS